MNIMTNATESENLLSTEQAAYFHTLKVHFQKFIFKWHNGDTPVCALIQVTGEGRKKMVQRNQSKPIWNQLLVGFFKSYTVTAKLILATHVALVHKLVAKMIYLVLQNAEGVMEKVVKLLWKLREKWRKMPLMMNNRFWVSGVI